MADETANPVTPATPTKKSKSDRYVKLGFLAAALIAAGWITWSQYVGPRPPGTWQGDLAAALDQAAKEKRNVVVLFYQRPPSEEYKMMVDITLARPKNQEMLRNSNDILVLKAVRDSDPLVKKYRLRVRPTTLLLAPDGSELTRREGYMPETDMADFLKGTAKK